MADMVSFLDVMKQRTPSVIAMTISAHDTRETKGATSLVYSLRHGYRLSILITIHIYDHLGGINVIIMI